MAEGASSLEEKAATSNSTLKNMDEMRSLNPERDSAPPLAPIREIGSVYPAFDYSGNRPSKTL
jgi:hypothetical protein